MMTTRPLRLPRGLLTVLLLTGAATTVSGKELPRGFAASPAATGCEAFGSDFKKLEGSDTCVRVSGSVTVQQTFSTNGGGGSGLFRR